MNKRFLKGLILYAIVFLVIAGCGLALLWDYMDAYEQSRPINAVKSYVSSLTKEKMCEESVDLLSQLDSNLQTKQESSSIICQSVSSNISFAKKGKDSSSSRQVFILRDGKQVIGEITITLGDESKYGFHVWSVTEEKFDFSYLLCEEARITVPSDYSVFVNGTILDESYITESGIHYSALEPFYDGIPLPTLVTYSAGNILGDVTISAIDQNAETVSVKENLDYNLLLPPCSQDQADNISAFADGFVQAYINFTGASNHQLSTNFVKLSQYLIPDSELIQRLRTAIDGLKYAQSRGDTLKQIVMNQVSDMGGERFYCDLTYIVETVGREGAVETTNNLKLIILETENGLKIEAMTRY